MDKLKHTLNNISILKLFIVSMLIFCSSIYSFAGNSNEIEINQWLSKGPIRIDYPVFSDQKNLKGNTIKLDDLLKWQADDVLGWGPKNRALNWTVLQTNEENTLELKNKSDAVPEIQYLAAYIKTDRWIKSTLKVSSYFPFQIFLNGILLETKPASEKSNKDSTQNKMGEIEKELKLEAGKHLLLLKTMKDPDNKNDWTVHASLQPEDSTHINQISVSTSPVNLMNIERLLDSPDIRSIDLSADGELVAINMRQIIKPTDKSESWFEIRNTKSGKSVQKLRGSLDISNFKWAQKDKKYAYTSSGNEGTNLWVGNFDNGDIQLLLKEVKGFGDYYWSPNNNFIIYSVSEEGEESKSGLNKLAGLQDRQPWWKNRSYLYLVDVASHVKKRLTAGLRSTSFHDFNPDGSKVVFSTTKPDYKERPYTKTSFFELDLNTMKLDSVFTGRFAGSALYSQNGNQLLITGGPSLFGDLGLNVSENKIPNDYDTQAFLLDLKTKKVNPITKYFNPAISRVYWSKFDNRIYLGVTDRSYRYLYQFNPNNERFKKIDLDVEVLDNWQIASELGMLVYTGTSATVPEKIYTYNLKSNKGKLLFSPSDEDFANVQFGNLERWTFKNEKDVEIEGRIYYPPNFDPQKKYPCIVYYYGGTVPVERSFGGRYPKNIWAANGYIVYVMQPSGATGFGQDFSALHVNDWGKIVADEIILGVKEFISAHPFVDPNRLSSIGASYGGFMTMLLQTRTDMFACAIAHAGISSLSSYWGEGYWGYSYSAVATANSFPWNRKDIYIDQSPLFYADKITTPLLLLHGKMDTNVPPGESIQLYTALKLLGREVEYIEIADQNHHIMEYNKRKKWTKTIIAWFDKYLKEQPEWWDELYPAN